MTRHVVSTALLFRGQWTLKEIFIGLKRAKALDCNPFDEMIKVSYEGLDFTWLESYDFLNIAFKSSEKRRS